LIGDTVYGVPVVVEAVGDIVAQAAAGFASAHGASHATGGAPSYEDIINSPTEPPSHQPELTNAQLSAPLLNPSLITRCGVPDTMGVKIQVAVKMGRAIGVTVTTNPPNHVIAACVDRAVRRLQWPVSTKTDFVTTTY
jgi:hypothetical protein